MDRHRSCLPHHLSDAHPICATRQRGVIRYPYIQPHERADGTHTPLYLTQSKMVCRVQHQACLDSAPSRPDPPRDPSPEGFAAGLSVGVIRLAPVGQIGQDLSCHQLEGSDADAEREGREVRLRPTHRPRPRVARAKHGRPVVVVLSVEEYERLKALDTPETRPETEKRE